MERVAGKEGPKTLRADDSVRQSRSSCLWVCPSFLSAVAASPTKHRSASHASSPPRAIASSPTAMYDDGIETYIDFEPQGDVDMITVRARFARRRHALRALGFETEATGNDAAEHAEAHSKVAGTLRVHRQLGDVSLVPRDDGHGMTPATSSRCVRSRPLRSDEPGG